MGKGKKVALLVGVGNYGGGLKPLQCPANGVNELATVLQAPAIGGFEVVSLIDPDVGKMRGQIGEVFGQLAQSDLALFYFTGHGIKDMTGEFYLTTAQTQLFDNGRPNPGTAVEAEFVKRVIGNCYAQRKVIILDCCFGAAFTEGFLTMDDGSVDVQTAIGGEGWVVLTAATSRNYALEQEGEPLSVYTRYLVEGLKTGAAAQEEQKYVSVGQLHTYVRNKIKIAAPTMAPAIFNGYGGEEIWLVQKAINPENIYRQKVQSKVRRGRIAPAGRRFLEIWQTRLSISSERVQAITGEVLKPFAEKQRHLELYMETLRDEISEEFPLSPEAIKDLQDLQRLWNLQDEDVEPLIAEAGQHIKENVEKQTRFLDEWPKSSSVPEYRLAAVRDASKAINKSNFLLTSSLLWEESQSLWKEVVRHIPSKGLRFFLIKQTNLLKLETNVAHIGYRSEECFSTLMQFRESIQHSMSLFCEQDILINFEITDKPFLDYYLSNLESLWNKVVHQIQPLGIRALLIQQGFLMDYDGGAAIIGIFSSNLLKQAESKKSNVEIAFQEATGSPTDITFEKAQPLVPEDFDQEIWQEVLQVLQPNGTKALMIQQASLVDFDGVSAKIKIKSRPLLEMAVSRIGNLQIAFKKILGCPVNVITESDSSGEIQSN